LGRTHNGAEVDLLLTIKDNCYGFEFKFSDTPNTTKSMQQALIDIKLNHLFIIYPGPREIKLNWDWPGKLVGI